MDYPLIRNSLVCPFCNGRKGKGLLTCWPCYHSHDLRGELSASDRAILDHQETMGLNGQAATIFCLLMSALIVTVLMLARVFILK